MAREIFEVTKDRFHLQDPCCYILQGTWPKEAKMRAKLDGSEVKAEIQRLEVVSALERFKDPDLMRGERITAAVQLPESLEGYQKLSIYAEMPEKTFCWFSISVKNLEKRRGKPQFYIEEEKVQQGFLRVRGWAVAAEPVRIQIFDENKEKISAEILRTERVDVEQLYEEVAPVIFDPKVMSKRVNQAAGEAVQCAVVLVVVRTSDEDFVALHRDVHVRMEFAGKGCLSALYGNNVAVNLDFNAGRNGNRHSTNTRHCLYLPYHTNARTSPPTFSSRAFLSVMTPLDVETMATPRPRSTFGSSCAPAYTRRPGLETRLMPVIAF